VAQQIGRTAFISAEINLSFIKYSYINFKKNKNIGHDASVTEYKNLKHVIYGGKLTFL